ncbi:hypothetical protein DPMN_095695 [Dreissena polymorpha]|uniref:Uncharacterized protein n=2 Tax=Dreissena polymorpha TaxID=45954 RepID=A0A9D4L8G2_DREPO|nr:hypothetical protein DPMN_095695 [Dreissena polymorpha]
MGGQERMRPLWRMYLRGTDGVLFVVDSADRDRIPEAREELLRILDTPEMKNVPLVVIANKQDLPGSIDCKELGKRLQLPQMSTRPWVLHGACATTGEGICESMESLAKMVKEYKSKNK